MRYRVGHAIVAGPTGFSNFPTLNGPISSCPGGCANEGAVLFELNSTGTALNYGTYLGGSSGSIGYQVATDLSGDAYVAGTTGSADFPVSSNALQPSCAACAGGGSTGFAIELDPAASGSASLLYSSFVGGSGRPAYHVSGAPESASAIAVDKTGDAFIVGSTNSIDFPVAGGLPSADVGVCPGDPSNCPGAAFVAKFAPGQNGNFSLAYSTYFGGNAKTVGSSIAIDGSGDAYIAGATQSTTGNFPTVNAYQSSCGACANTPPGSNAYVAELNPNGNGLLYSTYFGSVAGTPISNSIANDTKAVAIGLDSLGDIFFAGGTDATDIPTTSGAFLTACPALVNSDRPCNSAFLTELNPSLANQLVYSTYLSGTTDTAVAAAALQQPVSEVIGLAVDSDGRPYASGATDESDFPLTAGALNSGPCAAQECGFVAKFDTTHSGANSLAYSTLLAGTTGPTGLARIAVDSAGDAYVAGVTIATDYPVRNAFQGSCPDCVNDRTSAVVSELNPGGTALLYSTYLGGTSDPYLGIEDGSELGLGIGVAPSGNIVVSGASDSNTFPLSTDATSPCPGSFVTELDPAATPANQLVFSSCLGNATDFAIAQAFSASIAPFGTSIYIAGGTASSDLPVTADAYQSQCRQCTFDDYNAFFGVLAPEGAVTASPTATPTPTSTAIATPTATATAAATATTTATPTPTIAATATATAAATKTATATATIASTPTPTATGSPAPTLTATPMPTPTSTPLGGVAALIEKGRSGAKRGGSDDLGSFSYTPSDAAGQILSSAKVTVSRPALFSSLTLTASLGGEQIGAATVNAPEITATTTFIFSPPLTIPPGGGKSLIFTLSGVIAARHVGSLSEVKLAGNTGAGGAFGGSGTLALALGMFGFVMLPAGFRTRQRASLILAALIVLIAGLAGCGGSSSGSAGASNPSDQELVALTVAQNGNPVSVSGLPINLGSVRAR